MAAFLGSLKRTGWVEGQNLIVDWRELHARSNWAPGWVYELLRLPVELIVVENSEALRAAAAATSQTPVVMIDSGSLDDGVVDPATSGYTTNLAHPGGNITGVFTPEPYAKRVELMKTVLPHVVRVGMLHPNVIGSPAEQIVLDSEAAARGLGMEPIEMPVDLQPTGRSGRSGECSRATGGRATTCRLPRSH
jgi:putative ABC transport system substrate-binding protein